MAVDIGAEAIDRAITSGAGKTYINKDHPATIAGTITSIDIWAYENISGLYIGVFYVESPGWLVARTSQAITGTITAGDLVNKEVSIVVEIGEYIGCYFTGGRIERDMNEYSGVWTADGEHIGPGDMANYSLSTTSAISLGGYIGAPPVGKASWNIAPRVMMMGGW